MIKIVNGDITKATEEVIGHQVNCSMAMGSGVARALMEKFPDLKNDYLRFSKRYATPEDRLGKMQIVGTPTKLIANLFGQLSFGRSKTVVYTDYKALNKSLIDLKDYAKLREFSVCLPYGIGCGLANGDWDVVYPMIDEVFDGYEVTLYKL